MSQKMRPETAPANEYIAAIKTTAIGSVANIDPMPENMAVTRKTTIAMPTKTPI